LASSAAKEKFDYVLAAGGDGTLNQVLNGILQNQKVTDSPAIGIIPLGTGNDFARTCGIRPDASQISNLLSKSDPLLTDVGTIGCSDDAGKEIIKYFINACSIGMGPEVVKRLTKSDRSLGPLITYIKAITATFFTHQPQEVVIEAKHWAWHGKMRVAAVANGQSFGNAMFIAPNASPDDGVFSTFIAGDLSLLKFLLSLQKIKAKTKVKDNLIFYNDCTSIQISAPEPCPIEAEGELMGWLPMKIEMLPKKIKFLR
jgi:diacylglycerol kinase (ATP)